MPHVKLTQKKAKESLEFSENHPSHSKVVFSRRRKELYSKGVILFSYFPLIPFFCKIIHHCPCFLILPFISRFYNSYAPNNPFSILSFITSGIISVILRSFLSIKAIYLIIDCLLFRLVGLTSLKNRPFKAARSQKYPMEYQIYGSYLGLIVTKRYGNLRNLCFAEVAANRTTEPFFARSNKLQNAWSLFQFPYGSPNLTKDEHSSDWVFSFFMLSKSSRFTQLSPFALSKIISETRGGCRRACRRALCPSTS